MKKILLLPLSIILILTALEACRQNSTHAPLSEYPTDSINVYSSLKPNDDLHCGRYTYGLDNTVGNNIHYRMATDSSDVHMNFDITILELHPSITANLLSYLHGELLNWGFINVGDTIPPFEINEMTKKGFSQQEITRKFLDWEAELYYKQLKESPVILELEMGYNMYIEIYPVYLDERYVTYKKYSYYYTGGAHGNYSVFLQTYDRKTGESVNLDDMVKPDKIGKLREHIVQHMAKKYPIYSPVITVEAYLDSLNRWLGYTDRGVSMGVTKENERNRITVENYPVNDPGIHEAGLVITYEKYHLTPGVSGCPDILLPFDEIRDCLKEPFCNYHTDETKLVAEDYSDYPLYTEEVIDSIRKAWGPAEDGGPWPRDIYDWYKYRHGKIKRHYSLPRITGSWVGYSNSSDQRHTLTINADGCFAYIIEEAFHQDDAGNNRYNYKTIRGGYEYDPQTNRLKLKNWKWTTLPTDKNIEEYVKKRDPENKYMIIHSIEKDTMYIADEAGDLWPYYRKR